MCWGGEICIGLHDGDMPNDVIAINKGVQAFESDYPNYDVALNFYPDYGTNLFNEI